MSELLLFWKLKQHTLSLLQLILLTYDFCSYFHQFNHASFP